MAEMQNILPPSKFFFSIHDRQDCSRWTQFDRELKSGPAATYAVLFKAAYHTGKVSLSLRDLSAQCHGLSTRTIQNHTAFLKKLSFIGITRISNQVNTYSLILSPRVAGLIDYANIPINPGFPDYLADEERSLTEQCAREAFPDDYQDCNASEKARESYEIPEASGKNCVNEENQTAGKIEKPRSTRKKNGKPLTMRQLGMPMTKNFRHDDEKNASRAKRSANTKKFRHEDEKIAHPSSIAKKKTEDTPQSPPDAWEPWQSGVCEIDERHGGGGAYASRKKAKQEGSVISESNALASETQPSKAVKKNASAQQSSGAYSLSCNTGQRSQAACSHQGESNGCLVSVANFGGALLTALPFTLPLGEVQLITQDCPLPYLTTQAVFAFRAENCASVHGDGLVSTQILQDAVGSQAQKSAQKPVAAHVLPETQASTNTPKQSAHGSAAAKPNVGTFQSGTASQTCQTGQASASGTSVPLKAHEARGANGAQQAQTKTASNAPKVLPPRPRGISERIWYEMATKISDNERRDDFAALWLRYPKKSNIIQAIRAWKQQLQSQDIPSIEIIFADISELEKNNFTWRITSDRGDRRFMPSLDQFILYKSWLDNNNDKAPEEVSQITYISERDVQCQAQKPQMTKNTNTLAHYTEIFTPFCESLSKREICTAISLSATIDKPFSIAMQTDEELTNALSAHGTFATVRELSAFCNSIVQRNRASISAAELLIASCPFAADTMTLARLLQSMTDESVLRMNQENLAACLEKNKPSFAAPEELANWVREAELKMAV
ncbi:MAG: hypothetical protein IKO41_06130 [Lachnospiraceae bacterium]|nr:hypothetical protein [Lachnospiraceae bacterium]